MAEMNRSLHAAIILTLLFAVHAPAPAQTAATAAASRAEKYYRTELYFGRSKPDGALVSDEEWRDFLEETVTRRFPEGFTVVKASGQYRGSDSRIVSEPSEILIFLYPAKRKKEADKKIEEIRTAYVDRFDQESVLRVDVRKRVEVSFKE